MGQEPVEAVESRHNWPDGLHITRVLHEGKDIFKKNGRMAREKLEHVPSRPVMASYSKRSEESLVYAMRDPWIM